MYLSAALLAFLVGCNKQTEIVPTHPATINGVWHPTNYPQLELEFTDSTIIQRIGYPIITGYSIRLLSGTLQVGSTAKYSYVNAFGTLSTFNLHVVNLTATNCEVIRDFDPIKLSR